MIPPMVARPWFGTPQFGDFAASYWRAGSELLSVCKRDQESLDGLAFPTFYLYRHALELAIKDAVLWAEAGVAFVDERPHAPAPLLTHRLDVLAARLAAALSVLGELGHGDHATRCASALAPALEALQGLDSSGQRLRYPDDRSKGDAPTPQADASYDLAVVPDAIEPALEFVIGDIGVWLQDVMELLAEEAQLAIEWTGFISRYRMDQMWRQWVGVDEQMHNEFATDERHATSVALLDPRDGAC